MILTDVRMPKMGGLDLLATLKAKQNPATVIVMSAYGNVDLALEAMKAGAYDYVRKPFKPDEIVLALRKAEERESLRRENRALRSRSARRASSSRSSRRARRCTDIFRTITKIADYKTTVLIQGESGVGKELVARAHPPRSSRARRALRRRQLRRHPREPARERAVRPQARAPSPTPTPTARGLFEEADGGTLFLDEIGELPLNAPGEAACASLQEETIRRLGDTKDIKVDVRIIAATHRDLGAEAKAGRFREDLFYRINVLPIVDPAAARAHARTCTCSSITSSRATTRASARRSAASRRGAQAAPRVRWPGNVRELENTIERAMVLCRRRRHRRSRSAGAPARRARSRCRCSSRAASSRSRRRRAAIEEILIRRALQKTAATARGRRSCWKSATARCSTRSRTTRSPSCDSGHAATGSKLLGVPSSNG